MSESIVKWHKVVMRELTKEEQVNSFVADLFPHDAFFCDMPEDNQEILVVKPWGTDCDVCVKNSYGYGLMYESGWHDVIAWAEMPKYGEG